MAFSPKNHYHILECCTISGLDVVCDYLQKSTAQFVSFQQSRTIKRESSEGYISDKSSSNEAVDQLSPEANGRAGRRGVVIEQLLLSRIDEQSNVRR